MLSFCVTSSGCSGYGRCRTTTCSDAHWFQAGIIGSGPNKDKGSVGFDLIADNASARSHAISRLATLADLDALNVKVRLSMFLNSTLRLI